MEENFKIETDLYSLIKRETNEDKILEEIEKFGFDRPLKEGTPLYFSVTYNKPKVVKFLLKQGVNVNAKFDEHYTPLMSAVDEQNADMVKLLIKNGADVNLKDKHGNGALWKAVFNNNLEIVKILVKAKADPFKEIKDGWSIYSAAKHMEVKEIVEYFDTLKS